MGDATMLENVKDILMIDKIINKLHGLRSYIPGFVKDFYAQHRIFCYLLAIAGLLLIAFEGYKLFKMALYAGGATAFAALGYLYLAPLVADYTKGMIPEIVNTYVLVAVICGLVAVFLTKFAFNFMIMILGGGCGFLFGYMYVWRVLTAYFNTLEFLKLFPARCIIGGVFAAIAGLLFILIFKHVFMVGSGLGSAVFASILLRKVLVPGGDDNVKICFVVFGAILAIFAIIHQYKEEEKSQEFYF